MCVSPQVIYLQKEEVNRETVYAMHPTSVHGVEDMSTLAELHEAAIMHNLFLRYQKDNIYVRHQSVSHTKHHLFFFSCIHSFVFFHLIQTQTQIHSGLESKIGINLGPKLIFIENLMTILHVFSSLQI